MCLRTRRFVHTRQSLDDYKNMLNEYVACIIRFVCCLDIMSLWDYIPTDAIYGIYFSFQSVTSDIE